MSLFELVYTMVRMQFVATSVMVVLQSLSANIFWRCIFGVFVVVWTRSLTFCGFVKCLSPLKRLNCETSISTNCLPI